MELSPMREFRRVNGIYFCSYWRKVYTVLAVEGIWLTVKWLDGTNRIARHCTQWNPRDMVILNGRCYSERASYTELTFVLRESDLETR
jgi:hypothetical protein